MLILVLILVIIIVGLAVALVRKQGTSPAAPLRVTEANVHFRDSLILGVTLTVGTKQLWNSNTSNRSWVRFVQFYSGQLSMAFIIPPASEIDPAAPLILDLNQDATSQVARYATTPQAYMPAGYNDLWLKHIAGQNYALCLAKTDVALQTGRTLYDQPLTGADLIRMGEGVSATIPLLVVYTLD